MLLKMFYYLCESIIHLLQYYIADCIKLKRQVVQAQMHIDIILTGIKQFCLWLHKCIV